MIKKYLFLFCLFSFNLVSFCAELPDFERFIKILGAVESSNNPKAYNKSERAIGIYQIRLLYFKDAQKFDPELRKYEHKDCYSPEISKRVVKAYLSRYCKNFTWEEMTRKHNGGPTGDKKQSTIKYWQKFQKISLTIK